MARLSSREDSKEIQPSFLLAFGFIHRGIAKPEQIR
jgi:hypothetical protein